MSAEDLLDEIRAESLQQFLNDLRHDAFPLGGTHIPPLDEYMACPSSKPLSRGDIIEIQGPSGSGKTHIVYQLLQTCILPPHSPFGGWGKTAVIFDTDGTFNMPRFQTLLEANILSRTTALRQGTLSPRTLKRVFRDALSRVHISRPTSGIQLAASILHLEQYLTADSRCKKSETALVVIDSISTFYWADRFTIEQYRYVRKEERVDVHSPFQHVITAMQRLKATFSPVIVLTNWALHISRHPSSEDDYSDPPLYRQHLHPYLRFKTPEDFLDEETQPSNPVPTFITDISQEHTEEHTSPVTHERPSLFVDYHITLWSAPDATNAHSPMEPLEYVGVQRQLGAGGRTIHAAVRTSGRRESLELRMYIGEHDISWAI